MTRKSVSQQMLKNVLIAFFGVGQILDLYVKREHSLLASKALEAHFYSLYLKGGREGHNPGSVFFLGIGILCLI